MRQSHSQKLIRVPSTVIQCVYLNQEKTRKQKTTIFHSPYKNGKRNKDFINPSFVSSAIFYPQEYAESKPRKGYVKNQNQLKKQELYNQRIASKSNSARSLVKERTVKESRSVIEFDKSTEKKKTYYRRQIGRPIQENQQKLLQEDLNSLKKYQQSRREEKQNKSTEGKFPYLQNQQQDCSRKQNNRYSKKHLKEWISINEQLKNFEKSQRKLNKDRETEAMEKAINLNRAKVYQQQEASKTNARLLSNILKEQMELKRRRKEVLIKI